MIAGKSNHFKFSIVLVLVLGLILVGGVGVLASEDRSGGKITIALEKEPVNLDPVQALDTPSSRVIEQIFDPLISYDEGTKYVPNAAKSWENPDPLTWIFHLREGMKFHNGEEVTAEDLVYAWRQFLPVTDFEAPRNRLFMVDEIIKMDDYSVKVKLTEPFAPFLSVIAAGYMAPVPKDLVEEKGHEWFNRNPVGSGPFKLVEWKKGEQVVLERFEDYWMKKPNLESVVFRPIPESAVVTTELLTGGVDLSARVATDDIPRLKDNPDVIIDTSGGLSYFYMAFNLWTSEKANIVARQDVGENPFSDIRVRKAIYHAVPWNRIADELFKYDVSGARSYGPIPPAMGQYYNPELEDIALEYDPDKAKELLEEAGYPDGFETRIFAPVDPNRETFATMAKTYLQRVGIEASIKVLEWSVYLPKLASGDADMFLLGWLMAPDPYNVHYYLFHSDSWGPPGNRQRYKNEKVDELINKGQKITDVEERIEIYKELQRMIMSEYPHIPLYYTNEVRPYNKRVQDFQAHSALGFPLVTSWNNVWVKE